MLERILQTILCGMITSLVSSALVSAKVAAYSPDGLAEEPTKLNAADAASLDFFGYSVSVHRDTAIVGAPQDDDGGTNSGSAYVFERDPGGSNAWMEVAKLTAADAESEDWFGVSVALYVDTAVVGAYLSDDAGDWSGSAYIFERDHGGPNTWGQVAKLTTSDAFLHDFFGYAVAISGDTVLIGAAGNDDLGSGSGSAYIFERHHGGPSAWGQAAKLLAMEGVAGDKFGFSVSISNDTAIIGAEQGDAGIASGSAFIFERNHGGPGAWGQVARLKASDAASIDKFGGSVVIYGDMAVVGAWDRSFAGSGSAYVFERHHGGSNIWGEVAKLIPDDGVPGDRYGTAVALYGDTVIVGSPDTPNGTAYVYQRDSGGPTSWGQIARVNAADTAPGDQFGKRISLNGSTAFFGAPTDDDAGTGGSIFIGELDPIPSPVLLNDPLIPGDILEFKASGARPGERVLFLASLVGLGPGPCYPRLGGLCVDILEPSPIGRATADASGIAALTRTLPARIIVGQEVSTQAVIRRGPGDIDSVKTNTTTATVE